MHADVWDQSKLLLGRLLFVYWLACRVLHRKLCQEVNCSALPVSYWSTWQSGQPARALHTSVCIALQSAVAVQFAQGFQASCLAQSQLVPVHVYVLQRPDV
jgi:hypothetical protein